jgi:hypothetical protein
LTAPPAKLLTKLVHIDIGLFILAGVRPQEFHDRILVITVFLEALNTFLDGRKLAVIAYKSVGAFDRPGQYPL